MSATLGRSSAGKDSDRLMSTDSAIEWLRADGIIDPGVPATAKVLEGGVSSVVLQVEAGSTRVIVKQPRWRLLVEREWMADPARAGIEASALDYVSTILPNAAPRLVSFDPQRMAVVMSAARNSANWKEQLLAGVMDASTAEAVGRTLGRLHAASAADPSCRYRFDNLTIFRQLRLDPYYAAILEAHPRLDELVRTMLSRMLETRTALVHGDFTPKNILVGADGVWVLDWEIAHFGDPVFDLASVLAHLWIKTVHMSERATPLQYAIGRLLAGYAESVTLEDPRYLTEQTACFMLARVDGKSPAEYLRPHGRDRVRQLALAALDDPSLTTDRFGDWLMAAGAHD
jgi:5-methylthioribose kinase